MIFVRIIFAITVFYVGAKLMGYIGRQQEKYVSLSVQGTLLDIFSALLASSFTMFFLFFLPSLIVPELKLPNFLSIFSVVFAVMVGIQVSMKGADDVRKYGKVVALLISIGIPLWPATYFLSQLADEAVYGLSLFNDDGIVQFSVWMLGMSLLCPTILKITEPRS